jgi:hypothetical protein
MMKNIADGLAKGRRKRKGVFKENEIAAMGITKMLAVLVQLGIAGRAYRRILIDN